MTATFDIKDMDKERVTLGWSYIPICWYSLDVDVRI